MTYEPFVDANEAAKFLSLTPRTVLEMARRGRLPAHPLLGGNKKLRRTWRFRISELSEFTSSPTRAKVALKAVPTATKEIV